VVLDLDPVDGRGPSAIRRSFGHPAETILHQEGSVSMPGVTTTSVVMRASDQLSRRPRNMPDRGIGGPARGLHQHEIDQLNGMFWISGCPVSSVSG